MFDNLRQQSMQSAPEEAEAEQSSGSPLAFLQSGPVAGLFNSLTPPQRFILALMLFLNVSVLGCLALVIFERIALPF